ncbi:MAG: hypothetical protein LBC85_03730 [Fibromonadaceae bacterium]|jgi:multidrug efflux pump subunit AcrA (membrane-fusion protein)|nr:hypothetical protein [Fibromonadaceae bacterium]
MVRFNYGRNQLDSNCPSKPDAILAFRDAVASTTANDYETTSTPIGYFRSPIPAAANVLPIFPATGVAGNRPAGAESVKEYCNTIWRPAESGDCANAGKFVIDDPIASSLDIIKNFLIDVSEDDDTHFDGFKCLNNVTNSFGSNGNIVAGGSTKNIYDLLDGCYKALENQSSKLYNGYYVVRLHQQQDYDPRDKVLDGKYIFIYNQAQGTLQLPPTRNNARAMVFLENGVTNEFKLPTCVSGNPDGGNYKYNYFIYSLKDINRVVIGSPTCPLEGNFYFPTNSCAGIKNVIGNFRVQENKALVDDLMGAGILCRRSNRNTNPYCTQTERDDTMNPPQDPNNPQTVTEPPIDDSHWIPLTSRLSVKLENKEISREGAVGDPIDLEPSILVMPRVVRIASGQVANTAGLHPNYFTFMRLNGATAGLPSTNAISCTPGFNSNSGGRYTCHFPGRSDVSNFYVIIDGDNSGTTGNSSSSSGDAVTDAKAAADAAQRAAEAAKKSADDAQKVADDAQKAADDATAAAEMADADKRDAADAAAKAAKDAADAAAAAAKDAADAAKDAADAATRAENAGTTSEAERARDEAITAKNDAETEAKIADNKKKEADAAAEIAEREAEEAKRIVTSLTCNIGTQAVAVGSAVAINLNSSTFTCSNGATATSQTFNTNASTAGTFNNVRVSANCGGIEVSADCNGTLTVVALACASLTQHAKPGTVLISPPALTCNSSGGTVNATTATPTWSGRPNNSWTIPANATPGTTYSISATGVACNGVSGLTADCGTVTVAGITCSGTPATVMPGASISAPTLSCNNGASPASVSYNTGTGALTSFPATASQTGTHSISGVANCGSVATLQDIPFSCPAITVQTQPSCDFDPSWCPGVAWDDIKWGQNIGNGTGHGAGACFPRTHANQGPSCNSSRCTINRSSTTGNLGGIWFVYLPTNTTDQNHYGPQNIGSNVAKPTACVGPGGSTTPSSSSSATPSSSSVAPSSSSAGGGGGTPCDFDPSWCPGVAWDDIKWGQSIGNGTGHGAGACFPRTHQNQGPSCNSSRCTINRSATGGNLNGIWFVYLPTNTTDQNHYGPQNVGNNVAKPTSCTGP